MRAQKAEEPSMEDILTSIRKIIFEDDEEEQKAASVKGAQDAETVIIQNTDDIAPQPQMLSQQQSVPDPVINRSADLASETPNPSVLVERRENLDSKLDSDSLIQSVQPESEISNPVIKPANPGVPLSTAKPHDENKAPKVPGSQSALPQLDQFRNEVIPGFVEDKPDMDGIGNGAVNASQGAEASLSPTIDNVKSFESIQESDRKIEPVSSIPVTPVFTDSSASPVVAPMEPLISPDDVERRSVDERRNHPLRRGADQVENTQNGDLMSVQTNNSVHNAFERLKNMTTENLDSDVKEMIRPMLREWLDNNLPSMVERLVRDEIERVSRGG